MFSYLDKQENNVLNRKGVYKTKFFYENDSISLASVIKNYDLKGEPFPCYVIEQESFLTTTTNNGNNQFDGIMNSNLSEEAVDINDDSETTLEYKETALKELFWQQEKIILEFIN